MVKRRKRKLILEKKQPSPFSIHSQTQDLNANRLVQGILFDSYEPYRANRFIVFLQNEYSNKTISPAKINSIHFSHTTEQGNVICIESMLSFTTNDWVDDYKDMHICRIDLLDPTGVVVRSMDFDVALIKYEYKLNYSESEPLLPKFYYKIFD